VVDIAVVFNVTSKCLVITTPPWRSTWSYDPDFNVLFGTTGRDSKNNGGGGFPIAAVAGGVVGGTSVGPSLQYYAHAHARARTRGMRY
jgi:hypothetical protein